MSNNASKDVQSTGQLPLNFFSDDVAITQLPHVHAEDAEALPQLGREHPAVKRAKEYLQAHYAQEVPLRELARVASLSPFHLVRVFRQEVGLPPHAYQTQLRLARARTLLAQGYDVGSVAYATGFSDQSHFTRQFKRHFFVTPGSYSKTARFSWSASSKLLPRPNIFFTSSS